MGSPKDKTDYLNETKIRIRDGINRLGGSLTPSNTFRSYANELLNILSAMPKVTGEGSNITLNNTKSNGPVSILVQGNEDGNKVVTGQNQVVVSNKNLVCGKIANSSILSNGSIAANTVYEMYFAKVIQDTTYTVKTNEGQLVCGFYYTEPTIGSVSYNNSRMVQEGNLTFTAPITGYVSFRTLGNYNEAQLEQGSTSTSYIAHAEQVYPLSLGDIELYEGDEIQGDFIYRDGGEVEEITNATLLTQLANLEKAKSYEDQTNVVITSDSNNAQMTAQVVALRKLV